MRIRTKSVIIFLVLSLVPLAIIGLIAYKNGEEAIKKSLGSSFQQMAYETIDKVDRSLYEVYRNVQAWAELELMQEVITGDVDGKLSAFLMVTALGKRHGYLSNITVLNSEGEVIASSNPELIGQDFKQENFFKNTIGGKTYVEDVHLDDIGNTWVVTFSFPIKAKFEEDKIIGVLCSKWKADELFGVIQRPPIALPGRIMLLRADGLVISASEAEKVDIFKHNLIEAGLKSPLLAKRNTRGYLIETDKHNRRALIGYHRSMGYRDFNGLGWVVLVVQDIKTALRPIERLKIIIFGAGAIVGLLVIIISLIVTWRMTEPIVKISQVAKEVARGNFEKRANYSSGDEIGELAASFNQIIKDLKESKHIEQYRKDLERKVEEKPEN